MHTARIVVAVGLLAAFVLGIGGHAKAKAKVPNLQAQLLPLSAMPSGWTVDHTSASGTASTPKCLKDAIKSKKTAKATVSYDGGTSGLPSLEEDLDYYAVTSQAKRAITDWAHTLDGCRQITLTAGGDKFTGQVGAMAFPSMGQQSAAFQVSLTTKASQLDITLGIDVAAIRKGRTDVLLEYIDLGTPDVTTLQGFASKALRRVS